MNSPTMDASPVVPTFRSVRSICMRDFVVPVVIQHDHFQPHERVDGASGSYETLRFALMVWFYPPKDRPKEGPEALKGLFNYAEATRWINEKKGYSGILVDQTMEDLLDEFVDAALTYVDGIDLIRVQGMVYRCDLTDGEVCFMVERHYQQTDLELSVPMPAAQPRKAQAFTGPDVSLEPMHEVIESSLEGIEVGEILGGFHWNNQVRS